MIQNSSEAGSVRAQRCSRAAAPDTLPASARAKAAPIRIHSSSHRSAAAKCSDCKCMSIPQNPAGYVRSLRPGDQKRDDQIDKKARCEPKGIGVEAGSSRGKHLEDCGSSDSADHRSNIPQPGFGLMAQSPIGNIADDDTKPEGPIVHNSS